VSVDPPRQSIPFWQLTGIHREYGPCSKELDQQFRLFLRVEDQSGDALQVYICRRVMRWQQGWGRMQGGMCRKRSRGQHLARDWRKTLMRCCLWSGRRKEVAASHDKIFDSPSNIEFA